MGDRAGAAPHVLFCTTVAPAGRGSGGEVVSQAFVAALRDVARVTVLAYVRDRGERAAHPDDVHVGHRPIETAGASRAWLARWGWAAVVHRLPYSAAKYRSRRYRLAARSFVDARRPALVVVDHAQSGWLPASVLAAAPMVYLAHNVEQDLYAEAARESRAALRRVVYARERRLMGRLERRVADTAREVWTLTGPDADRFAGLGCVTRRFDPAPPAAGSEPLALAKRVDVALVGTWTWEPNRRSLCWFLEEVAPLLPSGLRVVVAGRTDTSTPPPRAGVELVGRVPDGLGLMAAARVVAVPSVAGAGLQVKTLDAIASGAQVVASPLALRGLADLPASVHVGHDAAGFAREVVAAVASPSSARPSPEALAWVSARRRAFGQAVAGAARELVSA